MEFVPLDFITRLFNGVGYTKTPQINNYNQVLTGKPEFLNPSNWDAYEIYMTTPQLYAVIQRKGYLLASGVWKHYKTNSDGTATEIPNSKIVSLLENPNPLTNGNDLIRQWNENKCVFGNNYEYVLRGLPSLPPKTLTNLPPASIQIKVSGKWYKQTKLSDIIDSYTLMEGGDVLDSFDTSEINHTRNINGKNPIKGESQLVSLHMPISNIRAAYGFRNIIINKKGALGILSSNSKDSSGGIPMDAKERQRIEKEYQRTYGIEDSQSQVIMTNAPLQWQSMSFPTKDLMLFEEISEDFLAIIDAYGMNANIFSKTQGSTYENLAEGLKQAYQSTIIPEAEELAMNRSRLLGLLDKGEFLSLDYSHIPVLQENEVEKATILNNKANAIKILVESGIYNPNEIKDIIEL